jgi:gliding motility-associated lipoprotein GldH
MKIKFLLILLCFLFLISCDKKRVFDNYKSVGNEWNKDSIVRFDLPELNPKEKYNLFLNLRNNNDYPFNNIFLIVSLEGQIKL